MKWFKHYNDASESNFLNELFDEFGHQGYACFFMLIEMVCQKIDNDLAEPLDFIEFSHNKVRRKLRISSTKVQLFLNFCSTKGKLFLEKDEQNFRICMPNIVKYMDKDSKYNRKRIVELSPKIKNKEKEEEKEYIVKKLSFLEKFKTLSETLNGSSESTHLVIKFKGILESSGLSASIPQNLGPWKEPFYRLIAAGETVSGLEKIIDYATTDSFWKGVIVNPFKLEKNYAQLKVKADQSDGKEKSIAELLEEGNAETNIH